VIAHLVTQQLSHYVIYATRALDYESLAFDCYACFNVLGARCVTILGRAAGQIIQERNDLVRHASKRLHRTKITRRVEVGDLVELFARACCSGGHYFVPRTWAPGLL
jgi:hypothetical protein